MIVYYRMTDIQSTHKPPIYVDNKFRLNEFCLMSFVDAYKDARPKVIFLCDYCPKEYKQMIDKIVPFPKEIYFTEAGINGTAVKQFMMAEEAVEDILFFQECDYIYIKNIGRKMEQAINALGMVSPYDHPNHYTEQEMFNIRVIGDTHYRTTANNTMTWGIRSDIFKDHSDIFKKYGYLDKENWVEMKREGHELWVPIPSFATHMFKDELAPCVDWGIV